MKFAQQLITNVKEPYYIRKRALLYTPNYYIHQRDLWNAQKSPALLSMWRQYPLMISPDINYYRPFLRNIVSFIGPNILVNIHWYQLRPKLPLQAELNTQKSPIKSAQMRYYKRKRALLHTQKSPMKYAKEPYEIRKRAVPCYLRDSNITLMKCVVR